MKKKYVIALDAGIGNLGVAVFPLGTVKPVLLRCITTESRLSQEKLAEASVRRCRTVTYRLAEILERFPAKYICAELPTGGALSSAAMFNMAMALAHVATFCAAKGVELRPITPTEVKRLVGKGTQTKDAVAHYVENTLHIKLPSLKKVREHIADAVAAYFVARKKFSVKS